MKNLYKETLDVLKDNGKTFQDVMWIGNDDFTISTENFIEVSKKTNYDNGWGGQEIACDLKIIGKDFVIIRNEYDGSEWWEFISLIKPNKNNSVNTLLSSFLSEEDFD